MRFGILGCGAISRLHAQAINAVDGAELAGVTDVDFRRACDMASSLGCRAYESYSDMLADSNVDAVCVCTPSGLHASFAIEALKSGKHVVLEKPMALTLADADAVIRASDESGRMVTVIMQLRFEPEIQRAKRMTDSGALGKIVTVDLSMNYCRSDEYYASSPWRGTVNMDGGALMNQGIHGVDLMLYLAGRVKNVQGCCRTLSHSIEAEDTAAAMLEFESGALGVITATTSAYPGYHRRLTVCGTKGSMVIVENKLERVDIEGEEACVYNYDVKSGKSEPLNIDATGHTMQIANLIAAADGRESLAVDAREGRKALELILEVYRTSDYIKS